MSFSLSSLDLTIKNLCLNCLSQCSSELTSGFSDFLIVTGLLDAHLVTISPDLSSFVILGSDKSDLTPYVHLSLSSGSPRRQALTW